MKNELIKLYRLFLLILLAIVLYFIWPYIDNLIYILALVFLLTTILLPAVDWLEGKIHSRIAAIIIVVLTVLLVLGFFLVLFVMQLSDEAVQFSKNIDPQIFNTTLNSISSGTIEKLPDFMQQFFQEQIPKINISQKIADFAKSVISQLLLLASQIGSMLFHFFMTIILTVILLFEYYNFKKTIVNILPNKYFETGLQLIYKIEKQVSRYLGGQLMAALSVAVMSIIALVLVDLLFHANLSLIVFIGIIAGLANLIPFIGPIIGMLPAIFIAVINNLQNPAGLENLFFVPHIIIAFIVVQQIDSNIVSPSVVGKSVGMHPLGVIIVVLIGGNMLGALGMLIAVPVAGVIKVVAQQVFGLLSYQKPMS